MRGKGWERRRGLVGGSGREGDKGGRIAGFKKQHCPRGEREQMAVENVALKAWKKGPVLTDLAVSH